MASYITQTKTIRIKNETAEYFQGKALNRAVDSLKGMLEEEILKFDGENLSVNTDKKNVNTAKNKESKDNPFETAAGKDLEDMLKCFKKNPDDFLKDVHGMFEEGKLTYENGKLEVDVGFEYQGFLDWCKDHRANPRIVFQNIGKEIGF